MVVLNEALRGASELDHDTVWQEIESLARALLRSGGRQQPALELEAMIPAPEGGDACYHARVKRMTHGGESAPAVLVAVERRRVGSPERELRECYQLTPRESAVALLLAARRSNSEIAAELCLSPHTVRRHTERVLLKMGLQRRTEVAAALRTGPGARPLSAPATPRRASRKRVVSTTEPVRHLHQEDVVRPLAEDRARVA